MSVIEDEYLDVLDELAYETIRLRTPGDALCIALDWMRRPLGNKDDDRHKPKSRPALQPDYRA